MYSITYRSCLQLSDGNQWDSTRERKPFRFKIGFIFFLFPFPCFYAPEWRIKTCILWYMKYCEACCLRVYSLIMIPFLSFFSSLSGCEQVIPGLDIGVSQLSIGERAKLTIPPSLGYGRRGFPGLFVNLMSSLFPLWRLFASSNPKKSPPRFRARFRHWTAQL